MKKISDYFPKSNSKGDKSNDSRRNAEGSSKIITLLNREVVEEKTSQGNFKEKNTLNPPSNVKQEPDVQCLIILPQKRIKLEQIKHEESEVDDDVYENPPKRRKIDALQSSLQVSTVEKVPRKVSKRLKLKLNLICDHCPKIFDARHKITQHMRKHMRAKCPLCHVELKLPSISDHLKNFHATEKNLKCEICSATFKSRQVFKNHQKSHDKKFKCDLCDKAFIYPSTLNYHRKAVHENPGSYGCEICGKKFDLKHLLKRHRQMHEKVQSQPPLKEFVTEIDNRKKLHQCKVCKETFESLKLLTDHIKSEHADKLNRLLFSCSICDEKVLFRYQLDRHLKTQHSEPSECDLCGKMFKIKSHLELHMSLHLPRVECKICGAKVKKWSLNGHMKTVHVAESKHQCKICSKFFKQRRNLTSHQKIHDKKFKCETCEKPFPSNAHLKKHQKLMHENPGSFSCETCHKKFNKIQILRAHQKTHDKFRPKPFKCQKCDYSTDSKKSFQAHQEVHERREAKEAAMKTPFKCEICGKFSKSKVQLNSHRHVVHFSKICICDLCGKSIKGKQHMRDHIAYHLRLNQKQNVDL